MAQLHDQFPWVVSQVFDLHFTCPAHRRVPPPGADSYLIYLYGWMRANVAKAPCFFILIPPNWHSNPIAFTQSSIRTLTSNLLLAQPFQTCHSPHSGGTHSS